MKNYMLLLFLGFLLASTSQAQAYLKKLKRNQVKIANGTTEYGSIGYERVLSSELKGHQSIWGAFIIPWEETHEGSTVKVDGYTAGFRHYFSKRKGMNGFFIGGGYLNQTIKYQGSGSNHLSGTISSATVAVGGTIAYDFLRLDLELNSYLNNRVDFRGTSYGTVTKGDIAERIGKKLGYEVDGNGELKIPFGFKISLGATF